MLLEGGGKGKKGEGGGNAKDIFIKQYKLKPSMMGQSIPGKRWWEDHLKF